MIVAIVDYGAGNLRSAEKALAEAAKGDARVVVTSDPEAVRKRLSMLQADGDMFEALDEAELDWASY